MNLYFDNGSTSFPKPREVADAMTAFTLNGGGSYGRSSHKRAYMATSLVEECRDLMGRKLGVENGENIAWAMNATHASNVILSSLELRGKIVLVSPLEHNCTMRPLVASGAVIRVMPSFSDGRIDINRVSAEHAVLAVVNHQGNVNGVIQPIEELRRVLQIPLMIDTAQSLGHIEVNAAEVDYAIFTGHKGLLGPTGTGGLYVREPSTLRPLLYGGTGSNSASYDMPTNFPEFLEAGTFNTVGLAGLKAALECNVTPCHTKSDFMEMMRETGKLRGVELIRANDEDVQGELFSFRHNAMDGAVIAHRLSEEYGIDCRFGLHCSALAHTTLGTTASGTVRVSPSKFHTVKEFEFFVKALAEIV